MKMVTHKFAFMGGHSWTGYFDGKPIAESCGNPSCTICSTHSSHLKTQKPKMECIILDDVESEKEEGK